VEEDTRSTVVPLVFHSISASPRPQLSTPNAHLSEIEFFANLKRLCAELHNETLFISSGPMRPLYPFPGSLEVVCGTWNGRKVLTEAAYWSSTTRQTQRRWIPLFHYSSLSVSTFRLTDEALAYDEQQRSASAFFKSTGNVWSSCTSSFSKS
jgi:hypothetical protein